MTCKKNLDSTHPQLNQYLKVCYIDKTLRLTSSWILNFSKSIFLQDFHGECNHHYHHWNST